MLNSNRILAIGVDDAPTDEGKLGRSSKMRFKGILDRVLALFGIIALAPMLLACIAMVVCVSPGPAIYTQTRVGFKGRTFKIYKIRTMHAQTRNDLSSPDDDRRLFKIGAALRRLSIDELPQLVNVLRGEMSLVGPRPHMAGQKIQGVLFEDAVLQYSKRYQVMPGMTGWAQINGCRGPALTREQLANRVAHDLHYVENWSLTFDAMILVKTACFGFIGKSAF